MGDRETCYRPVGEQSRPAVTIKLRTDLTNNQNLGNYIYIYIYANTFF